MKKNKFLNKFGMFLILILMLSNMSMSVCAQKDTIYLSLGTSTIGGTWLPIGAGMAAIVKEFHPYINITAETTGGGIDNLRLLKTGRIELALGTSGGAYEFIQKEKAENIRGIMGGSSSYSQMVVLADSDIKTIADLKGKKIHIGPPGSTGNDPARALLELYGLEMGKDWHPEYLGHGQAAELLADGVIDAWFCIGSYPVACLQDINVRRDLRLLKIEDEKMETLLDKYPYYSVGKVPAGVYRGVTEDVNALCLTTILLVDEKVDDEVVYNIIKTLLENPDQLKKIHSSGKEWNAKNATRGIDGVVVPFHPGAEKYLKEQGLL